MYHFIFSLWSICYADVYRHESGRFCNLPFFLTYFLSFHLSRVCFYIKIAVLCYIGDSWHAACKRTHNHSTAAWDRASTVDPSGVRWWWKYCNVNSGKSSILLFHVTVQLTKFYISGSKETKIKLCTLCLSIYIKKSHKTCVTPFITQERLYLC